MPNKCEYAAGAVLLGVAGYLTYRYVIRKSGDRAKPADDPGLAFAQTAADAVAEQRHLRRQDPGDPGQIDRHRYFFLYRRARDLGLANPALKSGPGLITLEQRIGKELDLVDAFVTKRVGTSQTRGPYFGGPPDPDIDQGEAQRLDLGSFVHSRTIDPAPTSEQEAVNASAPDERQARTLGELDLRKRHTIGILWRAAAIEAGLWSGTDADPVLKSSDLTLLLDRRLRTLERLRYQASAGATDAGIGSSFIGRSWAPVPASNKDDRRGPWLDSFFVRPFEAPSVPRNARSDDGSWVVEEFFSDRRNRITQRLSIQGDPTGGTFTLDFNDETTGPLPFDASANQVNDEISALPGLANIVARSRFGSLPQDSITIVLDGTIPRGAQFSVAANNLTGGTQPAPVLDMVLADTDVEVDEGFRYNPNTASPFHRWYRNHATDELDSNVWPATRIAGDQWTLAQGGLPGYAWILAPPRDMQRLSISGHPTGGTFRLKLGNQTTPDIPFDATASQVQSALDALAGGHDNFICQGGALPDLMVTLVFQNDTVADDFVTDTDTLSGGTNPQVTVSSRIAHSGDLPSKVIHDLFEPLLVPSGLPPMSRNDWWNRSWLHSDGLLAALHIEGLRHALLRQPPQPGARPDDAFNAVAGRYTLALEDYFRVRHVSWVDNGIMDPGRTDWFENDAVPVDDLQIGDQVLFDTNPALVALGGIAWDYPTVLVTDVDSALDKPNVTLGGLKVQGFGSIELDYPAYQLLCGKMADAALDRIRDFIPFEMARLKAQTLARNEVWVPPVKLAWDVGMITDTTSDESTALRRWNPYNDTWDDPGPWWIWMHLRSRVWADLFGHDTAESVFSRMPRAISWDPNTSQVKFSDPSPPYRPANAPPHVGTGPGFMEPPWEDEKNSDVDPRNVFFVPLFEPFGGWEAYFDAKVSTPGDAVWPSKLTPVKTDARWLARLAMSREDANRVRVIRPRPNANA